jgi:hypothetical protein
MELPMNDQHHPDELHDTETTDTAADEAMPIHLPMPDESMSQDIPPAMLALLSQIAASDPTLAAALLGKLIGYTGEPDRVVAPAGSRAYRLSAHSTPLLDAAIAKAQGGIRNAQNNRTNEHLKYSYADLAAVFDACRSACSEAGLAVTQVLWPKKGFIVVTTRLAHAGEWVESDFPVKAEVQKGVNSKQQVGIAITYGKRYALTSMLGIAAGEDTDGDDGEDDRGGGGREGPEDIGKRWREAVAAFDKLGVKPPQMLAMVNRGTVAELTHSDLSKLKTKYNEIQAERG